MDGPRRQRRKRGGRSAAAGDQAVEQAPGRLHPKPAGSLAFLWSAWGLLGAVKGSGARCTHAVCLAGAAQLPDRCSKLKGAQLWGGGESQRQPRRPCSARVAGAAQAQARLTATMCPHVAADQASTLSLDSLPLPTATALLPLVALLHSLVSRNVFKTCVAVVY